MIFRTVKELKEFLADKPDDMLTTYMDSDGSYLFVGVEVRERDINYFKQYDVDLEMINVSKLDPNTKVLFFP